ncbi:hypothetical protein D3C78_1849810 [compost metagenome]
MLKFDEAVGRQLDLPTLAFTKIDALHLDAAGANDLLGQTRQTRDLGVLTLSTTTLQCLELRRQVDDPRLPGIQRPESLFALGIEKPGFAFKKT